MRERSIDVLYLAHNRREFTDKTLELLIANTNWFLVDHVFLYDDNSEDGAGEGLLYAAREIDQWFDGRGSGFENFVHVERGFFGGPVAIMNHYLNQRKPLLFAKVDSDTAVPPGWLDCLVATWEEDQSIDLLGMEPMVGRAIEACSAADWAIWPPGDGAVPIRARGFEASSHIGGIGLMKRSCFLDHDRPSPRGTGGRFGFTEWQHSGKLKRGWLTPPLPVALLDKVPCEPWRSLSASYVARGWQRAWPPYEEEHRHIWGWLDENGSGGAQC